MTRTLTNTSPARIGVLVPGSNPVPEREFARLRAAVEFRYAGFFYPPKDTPDFCTGLVGQMRTPLEELKHWGAELVFIACTTASMVCDNLDFVAQIEAIVAAPVITAASASREALRALRVKTVAVASPYGEANNRIIADFLRGIGVEVVALEGLALDRSMEIWQQAARMSPGEVLDLSLRVDVEQAEALYLPCTGIVSLQAVDDFERTAGKPAVSSVQAGFWASLRRLGMDMPQTGGGRLLRTWTFADTAASAR